MTRAKRREKLALTLEKPAVKFYVLQPCVVDIRAKQIHYQIERISHKQQHHGK